MKPNELKEGYWYRIAHFEILAKYSKGMFHYDGLARDAVFYREDAYPAVLSDLCSPKIKEMPGKEVWFVLDDGGSIDVLVYGSCDSYTISHFHNLGDAEDYEIHTLDFGIAIAELSGAPVIGHEQAKELGLI